MSNNRQLDTLTKKNYKINKVLFAEETKIEGDILYISSNLCKEAFMHANQNIVLELKIDIITPEEYKSYINTVLDVQPLSVKEDNYAV